MECLFVIIFLCFAASRCSCIRTTTQTNPIFNVLNYGTTGHKDDTQAFLKAWKDACSASEGTPTLFIPKKKTLMLQPLLLEGPCDASTIIIELEGKITAPRSVDAWKWQGGDDKDAWIRFSDIKGLVIQGGGLIDGQGAPWWDCFEKYKCQRPSALHFVNCQNLQIKWLNQINSPMSHMRINGCNDSRVSHIHLVAPKDSPNTDGIDISQSSNVVIEHSHIETGDDCIGINGGSYFINITDIYCGPGHGISIGSLGRDGTFSAVEEVDIRNCTFTGTTNGARIKTWEGGSGYARRITFEDIVIVEAENPIIIDQNYDPNSGENAEKAVKISEITYRNIKGTSANESAVQLICDKAIGCTNIILDQINITSSDDGKETDAMCVNAQGKSSSSNVPQVLCLSN